VAGIMTWPGAALVAGIMTWPGAAHVAGIMTWPDAPSVAGIMTWPGAPRGPHRDVIRLVRAPGVEIIVGLPRVVETRLRV
jgi:hypothetical protein